MKRNETYLLSYIKGTLPKEEMAECDALMESSTEFSEKVNQLKATYSLIENYDAQRSIHTDAAWKRVNRKIKQDNIKRVSWNIARSAAAILLPLLLLQQYVIQPLLKETPPQEIITLTSAPGIVTKAVLPDGSEVWLNAQSELTYPREFIDNERTVELVGEAYFKVVSDDENRFNVVTPHKTIVSAYGTEFNVDAYKQKPLATIALAEGHVDISVENFTEKQALTPGQKATVNTMNNELQVAAADIYVETAWKDGKMVFRRESIKNIAEQLSKKFGVEMIVEGNATKDNRFTATFTNESLEDILELLRLSTSIDYSITNQERQSDNTFSKRIVRLTCK